MSPSLPLLLPAHDPAGQEQATEQAGHVLEQAVLPLAVYRNTQLGRPDLTERQFDHLRLLGALFDALAEYDTQVQLLLRLHRANTAGLNALLHRALDEGTLPAWTQHPDPTPAELRAEREADPVYRLGFARGHRKGCADTEARYEQVVRLYAQYAVLVPPPGYQPGPLTERLTVYLDGPAARQYAALPLETRQALDALTPGELHAHLTASANA